MELHGGLQQQQGNTHMAVCDISMQNCGGGEGHLGFLGFDILANMIQDVQGLSFPFELDPKVMRFPFPLSYLACMMM